MAAYTITEVKPQIFLLSFENHYDLAMHFLRYQEFYESPNPDFNSKSFTLIDFMEWYSKKYGDGNFTYPTDWGGFNVPSEIFQKALINIPDLNKYDFVMNSINREILNKTNGKAYYLIGTDTDDSSTLKHEIAHGFFYCNPNYKAEMLLLIQQLDSKIYQEIKNHLLSEMYCEAVIDDEIQAYLSTGFTSSMKTLLKKIKISVNKISKPFEEVFQKYYADDNN